MNALSSRQGCWVNFGSNAEWKMIQGGGALCKYKYTAGGLRNVYNLWSYQHRRKWQAAKSELRLPSWQARGWNRDDEPNPGKIWCQQSAGLARADFTGLHKYELWEIGRIVEMEHFSWFLHYDSPCFPVNSPSHNARGFIQDQERGDIIAFTWKFSSTWRCHEIPRKPYTLIPTLFAYSMRGPLPIS